MSDESDNFDIESDTESEIEMETSQSSACSFPVPSSSSEIAWSEESDRNSSPVYFPVPSEMDSDTTHSFGGSSLSETNNNPDDEENVHNASIIIGSPWNESIIIDLSSSNEMAVSEESDDRLDLVDPPVAQAETDSATDTLGVENGDEIHPNAEDGLSEGDQSVVICPVCRVNIKNRSPCSLSCGHMVCKVCLKEIINLGINKKCPVCRKVFTCSGIKKLYPM